MEKVKPRLIIELKIDGLPKADILTAEINEDDYQLVPTPGHDVTFTVLSYHSYDTGKKIMNIIVHKHLPKC